MMLANLIELPSRSDLAGFRPEIAVVVAMVAVLLHATLSFRVHRLTPLLITLTGMLTALWLSIQLGQSRIPGEGPWNGRVLWDQWLVSDPTSLYFRIFLYAAGTFTVLMMIASGFHKHEEGGATEFSVLLLGAVLGMAFMASTVNLLMIYLAVEMASLPSFVMVGFRRSTRPASEASIKYVVYGAAASGVMLYGLSLLYGLTGTLNVLEIAGLMPQLAKGAEAYLLSTALICIFVGVAFKLSAVPFHFWCPDVFEGATAEVAGFLSVASKGGAMALLLRFVLAIAGVQPGSPAVGDFAGVLAGGIAVIAAITMTLGNFAAYGQTNLKRLLAYSTIAHAGYMLMAVAALSVPGADRTKVVVAGTEAVMVYLVVYMFMNLGAFGVVAFVKRAVGSEDLSAWNGVGRRMPVVGVCMAIFLLSLTGIPPLAGFFAKFELFAALFQAARPNEARASYDWLLTSVLVIGLVNTLASLFYYVKVIRVMWINEPPEAAEPPQERFAAKAFSVAMMAPLLLLMIWWEPLTRATASAARRIYDPNAAAAPAPPAHGHGHHHGHDHKDAHHH
jgi:NADH-quinone oxidoreductase subunit N